MKCPQCSQLDTRVIDSRPVEAGASLRRRRSCDSCGYRFTTHERVILPPLFIVKKDGRREEFNAEKLRGGIANACNKRPVSTDAIDRAVSDIEIALRQESGSEVAATTVGELVMNKLYELDQVAFVRFASVYQRFDDVQLFAQLLDRMTRNTRRRSKSRATGKAGEAIEETEADETSDYSASTKQPDRARSTHKNGRQSDDPAATAASKSNAPKKAKTAVNGHPLPGLE